MRPSPPPIKYMGQLVRGEGAGVQSVSKLDHSRKNPLFLLFWGSYNCNETLHSCVIVCINFYRNYLCMF